MGKLNISPTYCRTFWKGYTSADSVKESHNLKAEWWIFIFSILICFTQFINSEVKAAFIMWTSISLMVSDLKSFARKSIALGDYNLLNEVLQTSCWCLVALGLTAWHH